jgi:phosphoribosylglycinamide formyltransferase-1
MFSTATYLGPYQVTQRHLWSQSSRLQSCRPRRFVRSIAFLKLQGELALFCGRRLYASAVRPSDAAAAGRVKRVGVLVSGTGRSLENLLQRIHTGTLLGAQIAVVVASRADCFALERAAQRHVPAEVVAARAFSDTDRFSEAITEVLVAYRVDLVVMAGFMHFYRIPPRYANRVLNIHPALLPAFCGRGFYGNRVHQAVLDFGAKVTGVTVHFADNEYDHGPIVLQSAVPVLDEDTVETLAARVFAEECRLLPEAVELFCQDALILDGRRVRIRQRQNV